MVTYTKKIKGTPVKRLILSPYIYSAKNKWQVTISNYKRDTVNTKFFKTKALATAFIRRYKLKW